MSPFSVAQVGQFLLFNSIHLGTDHNWRNVSQNQYDTFFMFETTYFVQLDCGKGWKVYSLETCIQAGRKWLLGWANKIAARTGKYWWTHTHTNPLVGYFSSVVFILFFLGGGGFSWFITLRLKCWCQRVTTFHPFWRNKTLIPAFTQALMGETGAICMCTRSSVLYVYIK